MTTNYFAIMFKCASLIALLISAIGLLNCSKLTIFKLEIYTQVNCIKK